MNLDKIETQEEKEAFDGMANSSEIPNGSGWKNGETCYVEDCSHDEIIFVGLSKNKAVAVCECVTSDRRVIMDKFWVSELLKEKPESPEQKADREREEWAQNVIGELMDSTGLDFTDNGDIQVVKAMYDLGYRKQNG